MKQDTNMEHSAEWLRGAVAVLGRMVDECQTVFESDLPHITQGNLEDYLAEYAELLAAAEAREAGEKRGQPCTCLSHQFVECRGAERLGKGWVCQRQQDADAAQPSAAEVIRVAKAALKPFGDGAVMSRIGRKDYSAMRERIVDWHGPSDFRAAKKALATISAWEAGNVQG